MKHEIIETKDGSKTIYLPHLDETYHSSHGAIQEALHVFIKNGLDFIEKNEIFVFEMGFGTGLNALLSLITSQNSNKTIHYTGIEAFPVEFEIIKEMDYCSILGTQHLNHFHLLHQLEWNQIHQVTSKFYFEKINVKIEDVDINSNQFDCIFYDAFGPRAQEEMWHPSILQKMYNILKPNGFFVTYCAKGQVKRDLKAIGFEVKSLPGPPGKREMTVGRRLKD